MQNVARILGTALTASLVLLGTACDKKPTEATPGEKLDSAIAEAKQAGQEAGQAVDNASEPWPETGSGRAGARR